MSQPFSGDISFTSGLIITKILSNDGFFSTVYEGHHAIHKKVAVKVLKPFLGEDPNSFTKRQIDLFAEGTKLKAAEHRNVVHVLDVLKATSGQVVMVTEFCSGGSAKTMAAGAPLSLPVARKILVETAMGIQALHSLNMIHRDIKPANILIDSKGIARIADFGCVTDPLMNGIGLPNAYTQHRAPECYGQNGIGTVRSDVWAFGITAYRLIHSDLDWAEIGHVHAIVQAGKLAQTLTWLPHIPKEWRNFIKRCLSHTPTNRFDSFSDVVSALERLPIDPDWICQSSLTSVKWTRDRGQRVHEVLWDRTDSVDQQWFATNRPRNGEGKHMSLGRSNGRVSKEDARTGLEEFFEKLRSKS